MIACATIRDCPNWIRTVNGDVQWFRPGEDSGPLVAGARLGPETHVLSILRDSFAHRWDTRVGVSALAPGEFYPRNLTPDTETGLGNVADSAIARALRYGVGFDGRALLPFMEMQGLSDDDLQAVISYLRTQSPVRNPVPAHHFNTLGKVVKATALAKPVGPSATPPAQSPRGLSVETGRYLVESVALCWACHTERSQMTGAMTGPRVGGTTGFTDSDDSAHTWSPPNITSDPETGRLGKMTEDQFVARFRQGRVIPGSPMPWQAFSRIAEDDLRSIYRYLKSIPPVKRDNGPPVVDVKKS